MSDLLQLPDSAVLSVRHMPIDECGNVSIFITLPDKTKNSVLTVGGKDYFPYTNKEEPYEAYADGFIVPRDELLAAPTLTLTTTAAFIKGGAFPTVGVRGTVTVYYHPEDEESADALFEKSDHGITPVSSRDDELCDGLTYRRISCKDKNGAPVELFLLIADPEKVGFATGVTDDGLPVAGENGALLYPISTVTQMANQARANGLPVLAATNADFFDIYGDFHPAGLSVANGRILYEAPELDRPFFGVLKDGTPVIATLSEHPEYKNELQMAVSGSHIILRDGKPFELAFPEGFSFIRAPRTTVGLCPDGRVMVLVADGRIPSYSQGTTLVDSTLIMRALGATDAINLDGGGSSTVFLYDEKTDDFKLENRPADLDRPNDCLIRPIYNSILLYQK